MRVQDRRLIAPGDAAAAAELAAIAASDFRRRCRDISSAATPARSADDVDLSAQNAGTSPAAPRRHRPLPGSISDADSFTGHGAGDISRDFARFAKNRAVTRHIAAARALTPLDCQRDEARLQIEPRHASRRRTVFLENR